MSKSMTVINKNPIYNSYNPPKTTPIQITGNNSSSHIASSVSNPRNTSKFQQLKHNFWPSSLPSSALPTTTNSHHNQETSSSSISSSNNFLSTLLGSFRNGNSVSAPPKQDKKVKQNIILIWNRIIFYDKNFCLAFKSILFLSLVLATDMLRMEGQSWFVIFQGHANHLLVNTESQFVVTKK